MEFRDLKRQYLEYKEELDGGIHSVLNQANFISGNQVEELEVELAKYVGVKYCITCANGTDALQLALMAWGIGQNDAVFVPDFTFFSSGEVVPYVGATPIFVDVEKDTFNIDPIQLELQIKQILKEGRLIPRVVIVVDLFGQPADMYSIKNIADKYNMLILEDGAQGFGGRIGEKRACSFGDISTTSFFPAKPLGCYGDGGAVFTDHDEWAQLLYSYRIHGKGKSKYDNIRIGMNSRLDTIQAAILKVKLRHFNKELKKVNQIANQYTKALACEERIHTPFVRESFYSSWAQYTVRLQSQKIRNHLMVYLKEHDIPSMVYYAVPMHLQKAFEIYDQRRSSAFMVAEELCKTALSLPIGPFLENVEIEYVIKKIFDFMVYY